MNMPMTKARLLALGLIAVACAGSCLDKIHEAGTSSTGTGGGQPDAGQSSSSGGEGGLSGQVVKPSTSVKWPGQMVVDGDALVVTSLDRDTGVGSLVRLTIGSWEATTLAGGTPGMSVGTALAADAQRFYFFAADGQGSAAVYALPRAGGSPAKIADVGTAGGDAGTAAQIGLTSAIAVDASRVYWTESGADPTLAGGSLKAAPLAGGAAATLVMIGAPEVPSGGLAVDATSVYWTTNLFQQTALGTVYAMPVAGGPQATLLGYVTPVQIAVAGSALYVLDQGTSEGDCSLSDGALTQVPLDGGTPGPVVDSLYGATTFAIAGGKAYVGTGVSCNGAPPNGGVGSAPLVPHSSLTPLVSGAWLPVSIAAAGADVYASEDTWPMSFPNMPGRPYGGGIVRSGE